MVDAIHCLLAEILSTKHIPPDWQITMLFEGLKPGKPQESVTSYRPLPVVDAVMNVMPWILLQQLQEYIEPVLPEHQASFRADRSTIDHIFTLSVMMEKCRRLHQPFHVVFLDISAPRAALWDVLKIHFTIYLIWFKPYSYF